MADDHPVDPALDVLFVLIAELHREGVLERKNITNMTRRLEMSDLPDLARRVALVPLCNEIDDPYEIRSHIHLVPGGGNEPEE